MSLITSLKRRLPSAAINRCPISKNFTSREQNRYSYYSKELNYGLNLKKHSFIILQIRLDAQTVVFLRNIILILYICTTSIFLHVTHFHWKLLLSYIDMHIHTHMINEKWKTTIVSAHTASISQGMERLQSSPGAAGSAVVSHR